MEFDQFTETVKDRLADIFGPDFKIEVTKVLKNNSVKLTGIMILHKEGTVCPTIYMEDYYTDFCDGREMEEIINDILRIYDRKRSVKVKKPYYLQGHKLRKESGTVKRCSSQEISGSRRHLCGHA